MHFLLEHQQNFVEDYCLNFLHPKLSQFELKALVQHVYACVHDRVYGHDDHAYKFLCFNDHDHGRGHAPDHAYALPDHAYVPDHVYARVHFCDHESDRVFHDYAHDDRDYVHALHGYDHDDEAIYP